MCAARTRADVELQLPRRFEMRYPAPSGELDVRVPRHAEFVPSAYEDGVKRVRERRIDSCGMASTSCEQVSG